MTRQLFAPWLLLLVGMSGGIGATYVGCPGCIERDRVNSTCEWTGDTTFPLDSQNREHQRHLIKDAQLAEDLSVRFADTEHKRLSGYKGHGGLIDNGRVVKECMARLFTTIENDHVVTSEQIQVARAQRNRAFDLAVGLLFLPLYSFGAAGACRRVWHRFASHPRYVGLVAMGLMSFAVSFLGLLGGQLWFAIWELVRIGNDHFGGSRAALNLWGEHSGALLIAGVLLFWFIASLRYWATSDDEPISTEGLAPNGIVLR
jgi:hypothetical protein